MLKRVMSASLFALFAGGLAFGQHCQQATAVASKDEASAKSCSSSCAGEKPTKCCMGGDALAKANLKMPEMMYVVGDEKFCCPKKAGELAKGDSKNIKYTVADKTYATESEATEAYSKALDSFVADVTTVKYAVGDQCVACPVGAKELAAKEGKKVQYRLASMSFDDVAAAEKVAKVAKEAADKVEMKILVGDKSFSCPMSASEAAKKDNKQVQYVVGESKIGCDKAAKVQLAKARAEAALAAISKAVEKKA